jgi:hypothetical protein
MDINSVTPVFKKPDIEYVVYFNCFETFMQLFYFQVTLGVFTDIFTDRLRISTWATESGT